MERESAHIEATPQRTERLASLFVETRWIGAEQSAIAHKSLLLIARTTKHACKLTVHKFYWNLTPPRPLL
jgi:hypothetical protein